MNPNTDQIKLPIGVLAGPELLEAAEDELLIEAGDRLLREMEAEKLKRVRVRKEMELVWVI